MRDWNVVVTVQEGGFVPACKVLEKYGAVKHSDFYNVLLMKVPDPESFLEALHRDYAIEGGFARVLARVTPVTRTFVFQSAEEFEANAREAVTPWIPALAGKVFHVRIHRRGFKGVLSSQEAERHLDRFLLDALAQAGAPGQVRFEDPDAVVVVETVGNRAGLSLWTRDELQRYPFLHLD